jgi:hypothetical protein
MVRIDYPQTLGQILMPIPHQCSRDGRNGNFGDPKMRERISKLFAHAARSAGLQVGRERRALQFSNEHLQKMLRPWPQQQTRADLIRPF